MNDIRSIRQQLRMTQAALADALGVTQATVSKWERGELPVRTRDLMAAQLLLQRSAA
jgi:DNA-binding transcriptional regulator YiaG